MEDKGTQVTPSISFYGLAQYNRPANVPAPDDSSPGAGADAARRVLHGADALTAMLGSDTPER